MSAGLFIKAAAKFPSHQVEAGRREFNRLSVKAKGELLAQLHDVKTSIYPWWLIALSPAAGVVGFWLGWSL